MTTRVCSFPLRVQVDAGFMRVVPIVLKLYVFTELCILTLFILANEVWPQEIWCFHQLSGSVTETGPVCACSYAPKFLQRQWAVSSAGLNRCEFGDICLPVSVYSHAQFWPVGLFDWNSSEICSLCFFVHLKSFL